MAYYYFVPVGGIVFILLIILLWRIQRRRAATVFVAPQNVVVPVQPTNINLYPQYQTSPNVNVNVNPQYPTYPTPTTQPTTPLQYPYPVAMPNQQPFYPTTPQHFSPASTTTLPLTDPATDGSDRMRQVQMLTAEIHRLESESREGNQQRIQELNRRVAELRGTDGLPGPIFLPPAYDVKQNIGRTEYGADGRG